MGDILLELSKNPNAKKAIRKLGLPLPLPQVLRRAQGPWEQRPLDGEYVDFIDTGLEAGALMGMSFDREGRLYYVDSVGNRVVRISAKPGAGGEGNGGDVTEQ